MTEHDDDHDRGLAFDLATLLSRRRLLSLAAGAGATVALAACSSDDSGADTRSADSASTTAGTTSDTTGTTGTTGTTESAATAGTTAATEPAATAATEPAASCDPIPEETGGPFPGDGSNGPNILAESGVVRSDIRSSIGSASGVADGVPLTIELTVTDTAAGCVPLPGAAVYVWHCDREGGYSMYSESVQDENYLRGVQEADADGRLTFTSVFPACYQGRWPHIHFEVYGSLDDATGGGEPIVTSQLALPEDVCTVVYATEGYEQSVSNMSRTSLDGDNVFGDGASQQVATMAGDAAAGYVASLTVPV